MSKRLVFIYSVVVILYFLFDFWSTWRFAAVDSNVFFHFSSLESWQLKVLLLFWGWVLLHLAVTIVSLWLVFLRKPLGYIILFLFCLYGLDSGVTVSLTIFTTDSSWYFFSNKLYALFNVIVFIMSSIAVVTILKNNYLSRKDSSTY